MNNFIKAISTKTNIVDKKDVFFIEQLIGLKNIAFDEDNIKFIASISTRKIAEIKEKVWDIRKSIILQYGSTDKIAKCIQLDISIDKQYKDDERKKYLAKLITSYYIFLDVYT